MASLGLGLYALALEAALEAKPEAALEAAVTLTDGASSEEEAAADGDAPPLKDPDDALLRADAALARNELIRDPESLSFPTLRNWGW